MKNFVDSTRVILGRLESVRLNLAKHPIRGCGANSYVHLPVIFAPLIGEVIIQNPLPARTNPEVVIVGTTGFPILYFYEDVAKVHVWA